MAIAVHRRAVCGARNSPHSQQDYKNPAMRAYIQIYGKIHYSPFDTKFKTRNSLFLTIFFGNQAYIRTFTK